MPRILKENKLSVALLILLVVTLPVLVIATRKPQESQSRAQATTTLYFLPSSTSTKPLITNVGQDFSLEMMVEPGLNFISLLKIEINYDPGKVSLTSTNPVAVNSALFPEIIEGPVYSSGKIKLVVSIGSDLSKYISTKSKVLTLNLQALNATPKTLVSFGSFTSAYSVARQDLGSENVLSSTNPAYIKISKASGIQRKPK